ncbi:MAG: mechanosensitive ion channel protein MscS [Actinobacteria bacterium RBG_13_35_12]|uniref:Mechanosensitive ion channel protein MscS n=1 Tax=Candidatus Sediminicultor quintus TaxID=1797291 RepID=A0A1F5A5V9_9BACT|nr:MAG: mechanosensitive ion channel protein MscS [Actinobacteria bacterium RBG_13_35_12]OGD13953.1 MAG: mechanosensitive ion channel protein MscS [Candidatus Atribacteria bacterium RBG_19FT_COMBO_35_14]OGD37131.1 MAG: mechanosensitive ion channel protein MscS [Candidatus Atribacteria bacterium RBG_16_35_8]
MINDFFQQTYFQNRVIDYIIVIAIFILLIISIQITKNILLKLLKTWVKKTTTKIDDKFVKAFEEKIKPFLNLIYFGAFYISIKRLTMDLQIERFFNIFVIILLTFFGIRFLLSITIYGFETYWVKKEKDRAKKQALKGIITVIKIIVWSIVLIIFLDNLGIKISALVAGLGIGGIAIALAAQSILGDLFSYFIIFFDRPFEIGDFIVVGDFLGTVEDIGIKTTRLRSLGGEELIFSNQDLTNSRVRNYKRMNRRRIVFKFGVIYQTTLTQLKKIPRIVEEIITQIPEATFDRAHFASYADFSLNFEVVYYANNSDYKKYMDIQQQINFQLKETFEKQKIEFAYPTQTVFLSNENKK